MSDEHCVNENKQDQEAEPVHQVPIAGPSFPLHGCQPHGRRRRRSSCCDVFITFV